MHTSSQIYYIACFVFLFFSLIEFYTKNEKLRKATFISATIFFILFWAPRGYLFSDWKNYEPLLNQVSSCPWTRLTTIEGYEPGFLVLLKVTSLFLNNYLFFQFIYSTACIVALHVIFYKISPFPSVSWLIFFLTGLELFGTIRNFIAVLIFYSALIFISEKKLIHYFAAIFLACLFHISALIFFPLYFLINREYNRKFLAIILFCGVVCYIFAFSPFDLLLEFFKLFSPKFASYFAGHYSDSFIPRSLGRLIWGCVGFVVLFFWNQIKTNNKCFIIIANLLLTNLFISFFLNSNGEIQRRGMMLFVLSYSLIIPMTLNTNVSILKNFMKFIILLCIIKIPGAYSNFRFYYENHLFQRSIMSYDERLELLEEYEMKN